MIGARIATLGPNTYYLGTQSRTDFACHCSVKGGSGVVL